MEYNILSTGCKAFESENILYIICIPIIFQHTVIEQQSEYKTVFTDCLAGHRFIVTV